MNDTLDALLERGLAERADAVQHAPGAAIVVARARRQVRRQRLLGAGLALVVAAGVAGAVPLLTRGPASTGPATGDVVIADLGEGKSLVWDHSPEGALTLCLADDRQRECEPAVTGAGGRPAVHVVGDAVFGLAGRRYSYVTVRVGSDEEVVARTAPANGMTAFVLLAPMDGVLSGEAGPVVVSATGADGATVQTTAGGVGTGIKVTPRSATSLVTLQGPDPAQGTGGLYGWTRDGWGCLTSGKATAGPPGLDDLTFPAWCQTLPEGRGAVSLGWTDDPADTTQTPGAVNLLVPAHTTRVTIDGHVARLTTVDDQTWATLPGNARIDDVQHAPVVVTGEDGEWHGTYLETALRGPMP